MEKGKCTVVNWKKKIYKLELMKFLEASVE